MGYCKFDGQVIKDLQSGLYEYNFSGFCEVCDKRINYKTGGVVFSEPFEHATFVCGDILCIMEAEVPRPEPVVKEDESKDN